ncbi:Solute carrier family 2, facilitated glucose transporter member 6, partial [Armadillidium nasatum]
MNNYFHSAHIGSIGCGAMMGYASPAGAILTSSHNGTNSSDIFLTFEQNSWFSSISNLGAVIGCPLAGVSLKYLGRRGTIIYAGIPTTIGWILIAAAPNFTVLLIGRVISGLYLGIFMLTVSTFTGEYSSPHIRGILSTFLQLLVFTGVLITYAMGGVFDNFRYIAAICSIFPVICSISLLFVKESPLFLLSKGKDKEAEEALIFYRGKNYDGIEKELNEMRVSLEQLNSSKASFKDLLKPQNLKPLLVVVLLMILQQTSGFMAVICNLSLIFKAAGSNMSENTSSVIVAVVQILSSVVCSFFVEKAGRKLLLIISSIIMAIALAILGIFFFLNENYKPVAENVSWLCLVGVVLYFVGYCSGFGVLPWTLLVIFQSLQDLIHPYGTYWMFCFFCVIGGIFSFIGVYETKGKTLQEITDYYSQVKTKEEKDISLNTDVKTSLFVQTKIFTAVSLEMLIYIFIFFK